MFVKTSFWLAALSLLFCLAAPILYFAGRMDMAGYKTMLSSATVGWFIFATTWATRARK